MKTSSFPAALCLPCLVLTLLTGCKEQEAEILRLKETISQTGEEKEALKKESKDLNRELAVLNQEVNKQQSARNEAEAKYRKSAASEKLTAQYRKDLEESLNRYSDAISGYRKKYLTP